MFRYCYWELQLITFDGSHYCRIFEMNRKLLSAKLISLQTFRTNQLFCSIRIEYNGKLCSQLEVTRSTELHYLHMVSIKTIYGMQLCYVLNFWFFFFRIWKNCRTGTRNLYIMPKNVSCTPQIKLTYKAQIEHKHIFSHI